NAAKRLGEGAMDWDVAGHPSSPRRRPLIPLWAYALDHPTNTLHRSHIHGVSPMQKLVQGLHHFQTNIFCSQRELFERLARGQNPEALFITCSDSRINPNLITQTE